MLYFLVTWHNKTLKKLSKAGGGSVTPSGETVWGSEDSSSTSPSDPLQDPSKQPQNPVIFVSPKSLGHLLSLQSSPNPNLKAGETCTSSSILELCNSTHQRHSGACISKYCYRVEQHLLECWSTITENSKQAPFIVRLASASWQSWQPTAGSLLRKTQKCSGSATSVSPSTCSGVTACFFFFGFAFCLAWQGKIEC